MALPPLPAWWTSHKVKDFWEDERCVRCGINLIAAHRNKVSCEEAQQIDISGNGAPHHGQLIALRKKAST